MKNLLLILFIACTATSCSAQSVDFKLNVPLNTPYKMEMAMKMDMDGEQSVIMNMNMKSTITFTKKENNNFTQESVNNAVKMDMDAGVMAMSYDSENPTDDPMSKMLGQQMENVVGKKTTVIMSEKGKIISSDDTDDNPANANPLGDMAMTASYPDKPVKPGDTWDSEVQVKDQMFIKATNKYVKKTTEGYLIETVGEILNKEKVSIGKLTSNSVLHPETFLTTSANMDMDMTIQGQAIKMIMEMTVNK